MLIRPAEAGDLEAITAIYRHEVLHGTGTFETVPPDLTEMTARHARIVATGYPFLVAEADGVRGYACAGPFRERQAFRFLVEDSVYVTQDGRGQGFGAALLSRLIEDCTARGFRQMVAVIGDSTNQASIRTHARCGFVPAGTLASVGWKSGCWLDVVMMLRALGVGDSTPPLSVGRISASRRCRDPGPTAR